MKEFDLNLICSSCYDEHIYPIKQLALWQHLFEEIGYELSIEHRLSEMDDKDGTKECVIYHAINKNDSSEHYTIMYSRELKKEYDF